VDDPLLVRRVERLGHIGRDPHGLVHRKLLLTLQPVPQRLALDVGHDVEEEPVRLPRVVQRQDVRVLEVGGGLDLGEEALGAHHGSELGLEHLERDLALVLEVVGQVDGGHSTLAELTLDSVEALEGPVQAGDGVGHAGEHTARRATSPPCCRP